MLLEKNQFSPASLVGKGRRWQGGETESTTGTGGTEGEVEEYTESGCRIQRGVKTLKEVHL